MLIHCAWPWAERHLSGCRITDWHPVQQQQQHYSYNSNGAKNSLMFLGIPMVGLMCSGENCDKIRALKCANLTEGGVTVDLKSTDCDEPVLPFSEWGARMGQCPNGKFVDNMKCEDSYCASITLSCCRSSEWYADANHTTTTPWFREENSNGQRCPPMHVIIGAKCRGRWCRDLQLICAQLHFV